MGYSIGVAHAPRRRKIPTPSRAARREEVYPQDLIDEAIADLLKKHKRPVTLKDMLRESIEHGEKDRPSIEGGDPVQPMGGVLDPQGPIGAAERLILINATVVMLAVDRAGDRADPGLRLVVPRRQHQGALPAGLGVFRPGRAGRLVDPGAGRDVPGRHRLDRHARPRSAQAARLAHGQAARDPGRVARLEVAVHLSRAGRRQRQPPRRAGRHAAALQHHLGERHEQLLRAAARQPDLRHGRHDDAARPAGRQARHLYRPQRAVQRRRLLRHALRRRVAASRPRSTTGSARRKAPAAPSMPASYTELVQPEHASLQPSTYGTVRTGPVRGRHPSTRCS